MAVKNGLHNALDLAAGFVVEHDAQWNHEDWEIFLAVLAEKGFPITDETKRNFGNILESCKYLYPIASAIVSEKKPAAKSKAKPKAKATAL